jgi:hypothetical protein
LIKFNTSSDSSGGSAPRTFSKYLEIVSLSTTHFVLRFGPTAEQNFLGSVFAILQSSIPFLRLKIACALRLVLLNRFLAEMYEKRF